MKRPRILWCGNARSSRSNGWSFPRKVEHLLRERTAGKSVLHQFGGLAKWGVRVDIDQTVRPDVIADAWLLPFTEDSFDVVIVDPPYHSINQQMKNDLLTAATFVARERVIWFHTMWMPRVPGVVAGRSWLVRVGDHCAVRCLQEFRIIRSHKKRTPPTFFRRGPAIRYNRWMVQPNRLPLGEATV